MDHLGAALLGLGNGAVFAALALAIVVTYRSSGVVNFATGAIGMFGAYTYAGFRAGQVNVIVPGLASTYDLPGELGFVPAAGLALLECALLGVLLHFCVFRPLREAPPLARAVASLGVLVVLQEMTSIRFGTAPVSVGSIYPRDRWELGSLIILSDRFYLALTVAAMAVAIAAAYRFTRFGLSTRAAAESQVGAYVSGISPDRVALANWIVSTVVAGAAGILIATISPVTPVAFTLFVVPALAAAVVGGFQNLVLTVAAGIAIGMLQAEALNVTGQYEWLPASGLAEVTPLVIILIALLIVGRGIPSRTGIIRQTLGKAPRPRSLALPAVVGSVAGVVALFATSDNWRAAVIGTMIGGVLALSWVVVTGYAGQVSVAQLSLAGAGAFTLTGVATTWGLPFPFAPLVAALVTSILGVIVSLPALRLKGLTLGVVTLGFAFAIEALWFRDTDIVPTTGSRVEPPSIFGIDLGIGSGSSFPRVQFGLLCLFVLVAVALAVAYLRRSTLGSAMLAVRANERSAAGLGVNVVRVKVASFAISSFIAGLGGCLLAYRRGTVSFDAFTTLGNLTLLSTSYLAGITSVWGGVLAGVMGSNGLVFTALDEWVHFGEWFAVVSGLLLILTLIMNPEGLAGGGHALAARLPLDRLRRTPSPAAAEAAVVAEQDAPLHGSARPGEVVLSVRGITVRYGGVTAAEDVALDVAAGKVVGLIGPNGAGKTTVIDAITGFASCEGTVVLAGIDISSVPPHRRLHQGMARTFQSIELYDDLTVEENVSVAAASLRVDERAAAIDRALAIVGIADVRDRNAGDLSQGQRQLVSIARACASRPKVLLLDEPAAGLDSTESQWLGGKIRALADAGTGILMVDHDMALVLGTCDVIYVLDLGRLIAQGDPPTIRADKTVAAAYLGATHADVPEPVA